MAGDQRMSRRVEQGSNIRSDLLPSSAGHGLLAMSQVEPIDHRDAGVMLCALSSCGAAIFSHGSFSWWIACPATSYRF